MTLKHHAPLDLPSGSRTLAAVVYVADRIAAEAGYSFRLDLQSLHIDPAVLEELRLSDQQLARVRERLPETFQEVEATFG